MTNSPNGSGLQRLPAMPELETEAANCEKHGAYTASIYQTIPGCRAIRSPCPECVKAKEAERAAETARAAEAGRQSRIRDLRENNGVPQRFYECTLDTYVANAPAQQRVLLAAREFVKRWPVNGDSGPSLILCGKPGTGKTHIACAIANAVNGLLSSAYFISVSAAIRTIKETYRKDSQHSEADAIEELLGFRLLILDEIGVQIGSEYEKTLLFEIINERYQRCLSTILISNLNRDELTAYIGERIMDRFKESGAVLAFDWESHRGKRAA